FVGGAGRRADLLLPQLRGGLPHRPPRGGAGPAGVRVLRLCPGGVGDAGGAPRAALLLLQLRRCRAAHRRLIPAGHQHFLRPAAGRRPEPFLLITNPKGWKTSTGRTPTGVKPATRGLILFPQRERGIPRMLSTEDNELLCRVGPNTPMGAF